jgi:hypothetical protein
LTKIGKKKVVVIRRKVRIFFLPEEGFEYVFESKYIDFFNLLKSVSACIMKN